MANKKFTQEEMDCLRENSYVLDVSPGLVHFSAEFKRIFWDAILSGEEPHSIVENLGINPEMLGKTRVAGLKGMIRNEAKSEKGFRDLDTRRRYMDGRSCLDEYMTPEGKIKYLKQQLAYKDQEIEFLKKIVSLGREDVEA